MADDQARDDALRLLRAARGIYIETHGGDESSFRAGAELDLVTAGERTGLPTGFDRHEAAVECLEAAGMIEPVGGPIYHVTEQGRRML